MTAETKSKKRDEHLYYHKEKESLECNTEITQVLGKSCLHIFHQHMQFKKHWLMIMIMKQQIKIRAKSTTQIPQNIIHHFHIGNIYTASVG